MSGPLDGTLVVDLSRALAGPHATMMLGDLGARVVKVEVPGTGDDTRGWGPPFVDPPDGGRRESTYFLSTNRNKESVSLDLKAEDDRELLLDLVRRADVLVENFRTGVLDRLGLGLERLHEVNPRLVVLSITGFGHDGPEGGRAGYDQIAQGEAGLMSLTGSGPEDPQKVGVPISDLLAGMYGAYGVLAALLERERTGEGTVVRTSPPGGSTNGGPQPRVSSPVPGTSTLITRAPRSPSIIVACGPASARDRSTTTVPSSGPVLPIRPTRAGRRRPRPAAVRRPRRSRCRRGSACRTAPR